MSQELKDLCDAYTLLNNILTKLANGPMAPWRTLLHARDYIDAEVSRIVRPAQTQKA